jgi:hypothetical protein
MISGLSLLHWSTFEPSVSPSPSSSPQPQLNIDDVELYEFEDTINKKYEYSVKYKSKNRL